MATRFLVGGPADGERLRLDDEVRAVCVPYMDGTYSYPGDRIPMRVGLDGYPEPDFYKLFEVGSARYELREDGWMHFVGCTSMSNPDTDAIPTKSPTNEYGGLTKKQWVMSQAYGNKASTKHPELDSNQRPAD